MKSLTRALKTTLKQIRRSGWLGWASVSVMTLSFLVTTIFFGLAFVLNLVLQSIENDPHIYVFFRAGVAESKIIDKQAEWESLENIESIVYTSETEALDEFKEYNEKTNPITAEAIRQNVLPSSLGIRLEKIDEAKSIISLVEEEATNNEDILSIGYSETVIENIKDLVNIVRMGGSVIIGMLVIVILLFTFLTTEFKIFYRAEEIGIMQLVGGSLWYIRLPFVLETMFYGIMGAVLSNLILYGSYTYITSYYSETNLLQFITRFFGNLPWPTISEREILLVVGATLAAGAFIGMINSIIAIRRYIK